MIENLPKAITPQVTHLKDPDMFWDFISLMPMTTHQVKCFVVCPRNLPWNDKSPCSWSSPWSQFSFFLSYQVQDVDAGNAMILWSQVSFLFSDRGTPNGYRFMNGYNWKVKVAKKKIVKEIIPLIRYGSHTFKMVNEDNEAVYCKFHYKTDQGIKCFDRLVVVIVIIIVIVKMKLFP